MTTSDPLPDSGERLVLSEGAYQHLIEELDRPPRLNLKLRDAMKRAEKRRRSW